MKVINPHVAGMDVGSQSHRVTISLGLKDFKEYGLYNENLLPQVNKITTVAVEST